MVPGRFFFFFFSCPCLRCSVKIVQTGVKEVVYNFAYSMCVGGRFFFFFLHVDDGTHDDLLSQGCCCGGCVLRGGGDIETVYSMTKRGRGRGRHRAHVSCEER